MGRNAKLMKAHGQPLRARVSPAAAMMSRSCCLPPACLVAHPTGLGTSFVTCVFDVLDFELLGSKRATPVLKQLLVLY